MKAQRYAKAWVQDSGGMEDLKFTSGVGARSPRNAMLGGEAGEGWSVSFWNLWERA